MKDNKKNNSELSSNLKCIGTPCACITQNAGCILHCTLYKWCILGEKETKHRFLSYFLIYRHFTSKSVFIGEMKHLFGRMQTRLIPSYTFQLSQNLNTIPSIRSNLTMTVLMINQQDKVAVLYSFYITYKCNLYMILHISPKVKHTITETMVWI